MSVPTDRLTAALEGRYRIERQLGAGGMATVYLAADLKHDRKVAIKVLKPELAAVLGAERFVQEIKTTAALSHPHILPLFDSGEAGGFLYYVMPYIEGETIREKLNREGQFGIEEAVKVTTEVADALDYAHRHGVIHRDIKPENILLHDGRPMVMDFGIALAVSAAAGGRMTETGLSLGTPHYMSPEQATADKQITARSDVYSLASVLYEMLAGEPPHTGGTAQAIIMKIIAERSKPVTELRGSVPPNVAAALAKALEKVPADRFDSAKHFADALVSPSFTTATAAAALGATAKVSSRTRALIGGLAAAAIVFAGVAAWAVSRPSAKPVARFRHAFSPGQELRGGFALAPDGSWLVYVGPGSNARETQLWMKARDAVEATPLAGTTGQGGSVTISPDGSLIGFQASGQARSIPAGGGVPTTIADGTNGPPVWSDDGAVFYADLQWRVRRIAASDGEDSVIFTPPSARYAVPYGALPRGRGLFILVCSINCSPSSELWVMDGRSGESRLVLADVAWAAYHEGRLHFVRRDGRAFGVPFDLGTLAVRGAPTPLFEGVQVDIVAGATLAPSSGTLAYVAGAGASEAFTAVWVSRDGTATPVNSGWTFDIAGLPSFALSPDGKRLAIALRTDENEDIWVRDLDRGVQSRLTFSDSSDTRPRWTPDGRSVTFISNRLGNFDLYQRRADGTGSDSLLLDLEPQILEAVWSRDREWLVLRLGGLSNTGGIDVYTRDIAVVRLGRDTVPRPLVATAKDEAVAALSPDGRWLAYESNETGSKEVFVKPFPDAESGKWQVSAAGGTSPVWSRDGRELFFISGDRELMTQAIVPGTTFQLGAQRALFTIDGSYLIGENYANVEVSPDGRRFLMARGTAVTRAGNAQLVVVENWLAEVERLMRARR